LASVHERGYPSDRPDDVHPGDARARCHMGSALDLARQCTERSGRTYLDLEHMPPLAPSPASTSKALIFAPQVARTNVPPVAAPPTKPTIAPVLSPSQVRTFLDCQARWWFKYALVLPEQKNSSLALGLAIHRALEVNFREKLETHEDFEAPGVVMIFRDAWMEQVGQTQFTRDEEQHDIRRIGERLVAKYMDEVAPNVEPAAVELEVRGEISGVSVRGRVDVLDVDGRLIDIKTASRRPSWVSPDYAFQLATYRQITPGASGEVRIDSLIKTMTPQIVQQSYTVGEADVRATQVLFPIVQEAMN